MRHKTSKICLFVRKFSYNDVEGKEYTTKLLTYTLVETVIFYPNATYSYLNYVYYRVKGERIRLDNILEDRFKPIRYNATYVGKKIGLIRNEIIMLSVSAP